MSGHTQLSIIAREPVIGELQGGLGLNGFNGSAALGSGGGDFVGVEAPISFQIAHLPFALPWLVSSTSACPPRANMM